mmetsp:Transcript_16933/g.26001  ORF Transcript_16933/g.26001 Transcript_16933/m.26001 type:complete len:478 (+) Transcript_16933:55-1488(+)
MATTFAESLSIDNLPLLDSVPPALPLIRISLLLLALLGSVGFYLKRCLRFIDKDEQIIIECLTEQIVISGPKTLFLPIIHKSSKVAKVLTLETAEYCVIKNSLSGDKRVVVGPKMVFLQPYDKILTGVGGKEKQKAISLKANEYVRFQDNRSGKIRVERGECCVVPGPDEVILRKEAAMDLKVHEYVKIHDRNTGAVRVERGEQLVFLGPFEEFIENKKQSAINVDEETAVLVRNRRTGQQHLVTEKKLFFPASDEEILEVRKLTKLADYEACIVRDKTGKDVFYFGSSDEHRSFFLPPHSSIVTLLWSRGRRRELRDLKIKILDLRPMYMSFEFNCRTNDNVELVLEGSFFWEITDLKAMIKFTNDTTGDICNHARSRFIELVSKVTLQEFMTKFNVIAEQVHKNDVTSFYSQRGVKVNEYYGIICFDASIFRNKSSYLHLPDSSRSTLLRSLRIIAQKLRQLSSLKKSSRRLPTV